MPQLLFLGAAAAVAYVGYRAFKREAERVHERVPLTCDLSAYTRRPDATARLSDGVLALEWAGGEGGRVSLRLAIRERRPDRRRARAAGAEEHRVGDGR